MPRGPNLRHIWIGGPTSALLITIALCTTRLCLILISNNSLSTLCTTFWHIIKNLFNWLSMRWGWIGVYLKLCLYSDTRYIHKCNIVEHCTHNGFNIIICSQTIVYKPLSFDLSSFVPFSYSSSTYQFNSLSAYQFIFSHFPSSLSHKYIYAPYML